MTPRDYGPEPRVLAELHRNTTRVCQYGCTQDVHLYPCGMRCDTHAPWAAGGHERPGRTAGKSD
jgi:hypothetical protein